MHLKFACQHNTTRRDIFLYLLSSLQLVEKYLPITRTTVLFSYTMTYRNIEILQAQQTRKFEGKQT